MTRTRVFLHHTLLAIAACVALASNVQAQDVHWLADYNAARREAQESQRPLMLDFGTANCTWCRQLDATTFRDPGVVKLLKDRFVAVRIDAGKDNGLTQMLNIHSFPTLLFAAPDGKILGKHEGYMEASSFTQQLQKTLRDCGPTPTAARLTFPVLESK